MNEERKKILFVCTGNTCRSPMAEVILRSELKKRKIKGVDVSSAGIFVCEHNINKHALEVLAENGLQPYKTFKPRQISQKIIEESYVIICMTESQADLLDGCGNVVSMREIVGYEVPDPYGMDIDAYRITADVFSKAMDEIIIRYILN